MSASPVEVVQRQLEAYNRRDLAAFLGLLAADAQVFEGGLIRRVHFVRP